MIIIQYCGINGVCQQPLTKFESYIHNYNIQVRADLSNFACNVLCKFLNVSYSVVYILFL